MSISQRSALTALWIFVATLTHLGTRPGSAQSAAEDEGQWMTNVRQLTFEGRRAGEGYFSRDGSQLVFQSERDSDNPFFQIYWMDLDTGDTVRVSPGHGKTTCAWIHPRGDRILFASTHHDPQALTKQKEELARREAGEERRYSWDYDPQFELYSYELESKRYTQLTDALGYDAEGSYSPDGRLIAFASNRRAFTDEMGQPQREAFQHDPAIMNDIYVMEADGSKVTRLTEALGYDGGPFFSPDGKRICWRRFAESGATAEIMTMNIDGSDKRQLTDLGAMSWAPYYHPSGKYLIFATNLQGFANFELYLVDTQGERNPVRVTSTEGFDGLPVFTPDGKQLAWTSNRTASKQSQIFLADWNHQRALQWLGLEPDIAASPAPADSLDPDQRANDALRASRSAFLPEDMLRHVDYLCRPELGGRLTGSPGEQLATAYVAAIFDQLQLQPAGDQGSWFQEFEFTAGVDLGTDNRLLRSGQSKPYIVGQSWQPLAFSKTGEVPAAPVVFAGYGIAAPQDGEHEEYDSFVHLDVQDKWILSFRFMPEEISAEQRQHLSRHSSLRYKAMTARDRRARGLIVVSGPNAKVKNQLVPLQFDATLSGASVPVICVTDALAQSWLEPMDKDLQDLQAALDSGEPQMGFTVKGLQLDAKIDIRKVKQRGRNVLGRLSAGEDANHQAVLVGAHIDHLGTGENASSLARDDEKGAIHFGADDNASGVAAMLEIAQYLSDQKRQGRLPMQRDVIFAAWSGEELGLIGSSHYAKTMEERLGRAGHGHEPVASSPSPRRHDTTTIPHGSEPPPGAGAHAKSEHESASQTSHGLAPALAACLNMDMVGRFEKRLVLQGVGSSSIWRGEIERRNAPIGLPITLQDDSYLPTDASTFFMRGVPILSAFTGSHTDYHTPRDTPDKLNYEAAAKIARFMGLITRSLALRDDAPDYVAQTAPPNGARRARLRAYLGTIPDYADSDVKGLRLSGVAKEGPASQAGLQGGDLIVELAGRKIDNIYDYTYAIEALQIGQPVKVTVKRGDQTITLEVTPGSRD